MKVPTLSKMQVVGSVPSKFPILEARAREAKIKRVMGMPGSFKFRLGAALASDNRGGKRWDI